MYGNQLNLLNFLISNYLLDIFEIDDINAIGNFLQLLGQTLITISYQNDYCKKKP